jgi:hypothetical protein
VILNLDAENSEIGESVLEAFSKSRFVLDVSNDAWLLPEGLEFDSHFYLPETAIAESEAWDKRLQNFGGYKSIRAIFKNMAVCNADKEGGSIIIEPTCHETLEAWSGGGISKSDNVIIPDTSTPEEIGAAVRLALSRCK